MSSGFIGNRVIEDSSWILNLTVTVLTVASIPIFILLVHLSTVAKNKLRQINQTNSVTPAEPYEAMTRKNSVSVSPTQMQKGDTDGDGFERMDDFGTKNPSASEPAFKGKEKDIIWPSNPEKKKERPPCPITDKQIEYQTDPTRITKLQANRDPQVEPQNRNFCPISEQCEMVRRNGSGKVRPKNFTGNPLGRGIVGQSPEPRNADPTPVNNVQSLEAIAPQFQYEQNKMITSNSENINPMVRTGTTKRIQVKKFNKVSPDFGPIKTVIITATETQTYKKLPANEETLNTTTETETETDPPFEDQSTKMRATVATETKKPAVYTGTTMPAEIAIVFKAVPKNLTTAATSTEGTKLSRSATIATEINETKKPLKAVATETKLPSAVAVKTKATIVPETKIPTATMAPEKPVKIVLQKNALKAQAPPSQSVPIVASMSISRQFVTLVGTSKSEKIIPSDFDVVNDMSDPEPSSKNIPQMTGTTGRSAQAADVTNQPTEMKRDPKLQLQKHVATDEVQILRSPTAETTSQPKSQSLPLVGNRNVESPRNILSESESAASSFITAKEKSQEQFPAFILDLDPEQKSLQRELNTDFDLPVESMSEFLPPTSMNSEILLNFPAARDSMLLLISNPTEQNGAGPFAGNDGLQEKESDFVITTVPDLARLLNDIQEIIPEIISPANHQADARSYLGVRPDSKSDMLAGAGKDTSWQPSHFPNIICHNTETMTPTTSEFRTECFTTLQLQPEVNEMPVESKSRSRSTHFPILHPQDLTGTTPAKIPANTTMSKSMSEVTAMGTDADFVSPEDKEQIKSNLIEDQARIAAEIARLNWLKEEEELFLDRTSGALAYFALDSAQMQLLLHKDMEVGPDGRSNPKAPCTTATCEVQTASAAPKVKTTSVKQ